MNFDGISDPNDVEVILQIGALSSRGAGANENPNIILERRLFPPENGASDPRNPANLSEIGRLASITLDASDRARLQNAAYLRLLVVREGNTDDFSGRVILAPPIVWGSFWRPIVVYGDEITPVQTPDGSAVSAAVNVSESIDLSLERAFPHIINRLNSTQGRNRVLEISWGSPPSTVVLPAGTGPGADGRIPAVPLASYRSLSFFVRRPIAENPANQTALDSAALRFILARGPASLGRPGETAIDVSIPLTDFGAAGTAPGEWARVDIYYRGANPRVEVGGVQVFNPFNSPVNVNAASFNAAGSGFGQGIDETQASYTAFFLEPGNMPLPAGNMAVDEIILEDPVPSYRLNAGASVEWTRPGVLVRFGDQAALADLSFQAAVETGAEGNPFEDDYRNGSIGMSGRTLTEFSLFGFRISGMYAYSLHASDAVDGGAEHTWAAGHTVSRFFGPLFIQDAFENAPADRTRSHRASIVLNTRIRSNLSGEAIYEDQRLRRRWQAGTGGRLAPQAPLYMFLDTAAGISERLEGSLELGNYAESWVNSAELLALDSGAGAENRDLVGSFRTRLATLPLGVEVYFRGSSSYSQLSNISHSSSLARLDVPLQPAGRNFRLLFRGEREYRRELFGREYFTASADFRHDAELWTDSVNDAVPLMFTLPFHSLFDPGMRDLMGEFADAGRSDYLQPHSSLFADRFELSLLTSGNYGLSSFFLPNRIQFRISRILEQRLDTPRDTLNVGALLGFSSVNMFGAMGARPIFNFYMGDEFSHSLEGAVSFPHGEPVGWNIRAVQNAFFFGFSGAELSFSNTLTVSSPARFGEGNRWTDVLTVAWTSPMESTLLGTLYAAFIGRAQGRNSWIPVGNLAQYDYELFRRNILEFIFERIPDIIDGDYNRFSLAVGHESIVRIFGRMNLSTFARLDFSQDNNTRIFSFLATIGTTLNLMF
jgi:hypothetical protein